MTATVRDHETRKRLRTEVYVNNNARDPSLFRSQLTGEIMISSIRMSMKWGEVLHVGTNRLNIDVLYMYRICR